MPTIWKPLLEGRSMTVCMTMLLILLCCQVTYVEAAQQSFPDDPAIIAVVVITFVCGLLGAIYLFKFFGISSARPPAMLPVDEFLPLPLIRKEPLSHDSYRFTFGLQPGYCLGLPIGQHISLKFDDAEGKSVLRSYTPVTDDSVTGEVQLVVKVYRKAPPKFPNGGAMSQHLESLNIGDRILVKGPKGHLNYKGKGKFSTKPLGKPLEERTCRHIGLMAGGTGITPMLQILQAVFVNPRYKDGTTKVKLIYANQTPDDILIRQELEEFASKFPDRFQLWYTVDRVGDPPTEWKYDIGFISTDMVKKHLLFGEEAKDSTQFFMCGPPPMIKFACIPALQACGFSEKDWSVF